ncbi:TlpA disulfide reductase family protein [Novosphingobium sp.]|uniref:TlpA disulfide reductase family protein n=1 Tax=Novosphingobium sp. TaxID=1874826 RepID=UPI003BAB0E4D
MDAQVPISRRTVLGGLAGTALAGLCTPAQAAASLELARYRGKVVYLDFWASWCGPCKLSFPFMQELAGRYPAGDLAVVTVNVDRQRGAADAFLRQVRSSLPVIYDAAGDLAQTWKVADMPTSLVFDRKGAMRFRQQGFFPGKLREYESHVAQLVQEA